jgi:antitoxin (DNA-binding transcriptional repressor) of toxin-antitoxin stability system
MKTLTIRKARQGLSHPAQMFNGNDQALVMCRGEPVARMLAVKPKMKVRSLMAFRAAMPVQKIPSERLVREDRDARD